LVFFSVVRFLVDDIVVRREDDKKASILTTCKILRNYFLYYFGGIIIMIGWFDYSRGFYFMRGREIERADNKKGFFRFDKIIIKKRKIVKFSVSFYASMECL
jgi:hypothetical protein